MYDNKFIAVIKCNNKILREKKDTVLLPFDSEYSILLKNLELRRVSVKIYIDGQDVLNKHSLNLEPNSELNLERFIKDTDKGNRFKFIQKSKEISDYRGDRIDDGLVRIEYQFALPVENIYNHYTNNNQYKYTINYLKDNYNTNNVNIRSFNYSNLSSIDVSNSSKNSFDYSSNSMPIDEGITVAGSISSQKFETVSSYPLEDRHYLIILRLKGYNKLDKEIIKPITVKDKLICSSCGLASKSEATYCSRCGTYLI